MSVSMGVMKPLLAKLTTLMDDEYKKLKGVRKQVSFLKDELTTMNAFLESLELMDELDPLSKDWRSHVREMAYDIEDCIDDFLRNLEISTAGPGDEGFVKQAARRLRTLRARHRISNQIDELKARVLEASERRKRYKLDEHVRSPGPSSSSVAIDPRVQALYTEAANLVGIDGPREELVRWLTDDAEQQLKVVSIVGFGGLGKTTLAKEAYHNILSGVSNTNTGEKFQFQCSAIVSVSRSPDISSLLSGIQSKLGIYKSSPPAHDMQDIIDTIKHHLKHRRLVYSTPTSSILTSSSVKLVISLHGLNIYLV